MALRFLLLTAIASLLFLANGQQPVTACCQPDALKLPRQQVKALVKKTEPINAPCCADMLHITGTIVLAVSVDAEGNVTCLERTSGHPLIVGVTVDSVKRWTFQPYTFEGTKKSFCGQLSLRYEANEHGVKYTIL